MRDLLVYDMKNKKIIKTPELKRGVGSFHISSFFLWDWPSIIILACILSNYLCVPIPMSNLIPTYPMLASKLAASPEFPGVSYWHTTKLVPPQFDNPHPI